MFALSEEFPEAKVFEDSVLHREFDLKQGRDLNNATAESKWSPGYDDYYTPDFWRRFGESQ